MTTSGTTTDYNLRTLSGDANFTLISLTTGPDGNVWFDGIDFSSGTIYAGVLNISTGSVTLYQNSSITSYGGPGAIVAGSDGNLYYYAKSGGSPADTYIFYVNPTTGVTSTAYTLDTYVDLTTMTASPGYLWVTDYYYNRIDYYPVVGGSGGGSYSIPSEDSYPGGLTYGSDGNMWFAASGNFVKLTPSGTFTQYTAPSGSSVGGFITGPDGALWFIDGASTPKIGRMTTSGSITEYTIPGTSISSFGGITVGPDSALWFSYKAGSTYELGRLGY